jgi:hypothetical protein
MQFLQDKSYELPLSLQHEHHLEILSACHMKILKYNLPCIISRFITTVYGVHFCQIIDLKSCNVFDKSKIMQSTNE